MVVRAHILA